MEINEFTELLHNAALTLDDEGDTWGHDLSRGESPLWERDWVLMGGGVFEIIGLISPNTDFLILMSETVSTIKKHFPNKNLRICPNQIYPSIQF